LDPTVEIISWLLLVGVCFGTVVPMESFLNQPIMASADVFDQY
jgi:hypothetical protein